MGFQIQLNALTPEVYISLRKRVNFKEYAYDDVKIALEHSLFSVVVMDGQTPIGIARIVGDNRIVFFIKDVVVDPNYQKMKIGKLLMECILDYISKVACQGAYIGLMSTPCCVDFYKKFGFIERPCEGYGPGMLKYFDSKEVRT